MKTRILALLFILSVLILCFAAVPPPGVMMEWLNSWTTNRGVLPVMGSNNLAITNRISGAGGGTSWNFYGISPNTVSRLIDNTNIARAVVGQSNGNWVAKFNGASDGQMATNFTAKGTFLTVEQNFSLGDSGAFYDPNASRFLAWDDSGVGTLTLGIDSANYGSVLINTKQTNSDTLDVSGGAQFFSDLYLLNGSAVHTTGGKSSFDGSVSFSQPTASRLAAFDGANPPHLTNSVYSDQTITDQQTALAGLTNLNTSATNYSVNASNALQTQITVATNALNVASNALRTAVGTTNNYVLTQSGTMNNVSSTNGNFNSPTNTATASNAVVATFQGLVGQSNDLARFQSNGTTVVTIKPSGFVGINTNVPAQALDVIGNVKASGQFLTGYSANQNLPAISHWQNTSYGIDLPNANYGGFVASSIVGGWNPQGIVLPTNALLGFVAQNVGGGGLSGNVISAIYYGGSPGIIAVTNLLVANSATVIGPFTNKSTIYASTNTAPFFTTNFSTLLVTNLALPQRAALFVQLAFDDVTGGIPSCTVVATNTVSTNNFGSISPTLSGLTLVGTVTITNHYTYYLDTNQVIKFTDTSSGGAAVRMIQSILFGVN